MCSSEKQLFSNSTFCIITLQITGRVTLVNERPKRIYNQKFAKFLQCMEGCKHFAIMEIQNLGYKKVSKNKFIKIVYTNRDKARLMLKKHHHNIYKCCLHRLLIHNLLKNFFLKDMIISKRGMCTVASNTCIVTTRKADHMLSLLASNVNYFGTHFCFINN